MTSGRKSSKITLRGPITKLANKGTGVQNPFLSFFMKISLNQRRAKKLAKALINDRLPVEGVWFARNQKRFEQIILRHINQYKS